MKTSKPYKQSNPICPHDKQECKPNFTGFMKMDGYLDCSNCPRYCNGVRATGGMPGLAMICNCFKKLFK